jgi:hypothetical protein
VGSRQVVVARPVSARSASLNSPALPLAQVGAFSKGPVRRGRLESRLRTTLPPSGLGPITHAGLTPVRRKS